MAYPFSGDQALFTIGAKKIAGGAVLYRDFWDLKQPAIFLFYLMGGWLFGFHEVGIHLFELLYWMGFAVVLLFTLKKYFDDRVILILTPLLTVGIYYAISGTWHLTQAEGLVGFPMFLALWFALEFKAREQGLPVPMFLSGLMGGVVLPFKFLFLPIVVSFWLAAIIHALVQNRSSIREVATRLATPVLAGVMLPLLIAFAYFAATGTLELVAYAYFEYPSRAMAELPGQSVGRLLHCIQWFLGWSAPLLGLAIFGTFFGRRRGLLTLNLWLWAAVGLVIIFIQRTSWWEYHFVLLLVPLGVLAAMGLDALWTKIKADDTGTFRRRGLLACLSLALLLSPVLLTLALKSVTLVRHRFALKKDQRLAYHSIVGQDYGVSDYETSFAEVAFLSEPTSLVGNIFVCGNPVYYHLSGRDQAIAANGWMLELFLAEQWQQMTRQLSEARPSYIFVSAAYTEVIRQKSPEMTHLLEVDYNVLRQSSAGVWYVLH